MRKVTSIIIHDILRNKIVLSYAIILAILCWSIFSLEDSGTKGALSLMNIVLFTVPLVSIIFSTIYIYNSAEFIELLVSQPVGRRHIWQSLYLGLASSLSIAFLLAAGIPMFIYVPLKLALIMTGIGIFITLVFISLAFLIAAITRDKARGIGFAIGLWLFFTIIFDGLLLFIVFQFADYPIEKPMIGFSFLSPVDLARILMLLQMDASIMMGYTGAVFKKFLGAGPGLMLAIAGLVAWVLIPYFISLRLFRKKDL